MPLVLARRDRLVYKRRALKPHQCKKCKRIIQPDSNYFTVVALNWGNRWAYESKFHTECLPVVISEWMQRCELKGEKVG